MSADERIVEALAGHFPESLDDIGCALRCGYSGESVAEHLAAVLEPIIRAREAKAWDEGHSAGVFNATVDPEVWCALATNPYRIEGNL